MAPRRFRAALCALALLLALLGAAAPALPPALLPDPLAPAGTGGLPAVDRALAKLSTHRRLLVIAAHPDDEDTTALTLVARQWGGEAAYLSLSRGEGGQNLIGEELGEALGILRTQELVAARAVDGGRQYFARAFDFGYTRSLDETLARWPLEALLEDAVRVVRRFRPQVILSVFGDDGSGGHGQHQAAGRVAHQVGALAADPGYRPDLGAPWRVEALYRSAWFAPERATVSTPLGAIDPFTGWSSQQLAALSRSQHRSQDMGRPLELGAREGKYTFVEGEGAAGGDLFGGIDTRLAGLVAALPAGPGRTELEARLERAAERARAARASLAPGRLAEAAEVLGELRVDLMAALTAARAALVDASASAVSGVDALLAEKVEVAGAGWLAARGLALEAVADRELLVAGEAVKVTATLWNAGRQPVDLVAVAAVGSDGVSSGSASNGAKTVAAGELVRFELALEVAPAAAPTSPYPLWRPRRGDLYDLGGVPPQIRGEPAAPPPVAVHFTLAAPGGPLTIAREVVHRRVDQAVGEVRRPLRVVPPVEVEAAKLLAVVTSSHPEESVAVELRSNAATPVAGTLESRSDCRAQPVEPARFELAPGARARFLRHVRACPGAAGARTTVRFVARLDDGRELDLALPTLEYPHVRPTPLPVAARVEVVPVDLVWPSIGAIGYLPGASDRVPAALAEAGLELARVSADDLLRGDLSRFAAIVIGSRAYETEPALAEGNARLLDYVRAGGLLIVQYQQYPFVEGGFAPLPLEIARPHGRVTDEASPVRPLEPAHAVFQRPNPIGEDDWRGWVQERSLYVPASWDPAYTPLVELEDPGQPPQRGALLVAPLGRGTYVYTGLAFFRQLPAGVPGALRLFANLLALGEPQESSP